MHLSESRPTGHLSWGPSLWVAIMSSRVALAQHLVVIIERAPANGKVCIAPARQISPQTARWHPYARKRHPRGGQWSGGPPDADRKPTARRCAETRVRPWFATAKTKWRSYTETMETVFLSAFSPDLSFILTSSVQLAVRGSKLCAGCSGSSVVRFNLNWAQEGNGCFYFSYKPSARSFEFVVEVFFKFELSFFYQLSTEMSLVDDNLNMFYDF